MLRIALFDWLEMLKHFDAIGPNVILLRRDWLCSSTLLDISKILSDDPLSGSAQVAVSSGGVGSNPTSDNNLFVFYLFFLSSTQRERVVVESDCLPSIS